MCSESLDGKPRSGNRQQRTGALWEKRTANCLYRMNSGLIADELRTRRSVRVIQRGHSVSEQFLMNLPRHSRWWCLSLEPHHVVRA